MAPVRTIALAKEIGVFFVAMFEPRLFAPAPFCVKAPVELRAAALPLLVVKVPELVTVVVVPTVQGAFTVRLVPVKAKDPVYFCAPPKVALAALVIVRDARGVVPPIGPASKIVPPPAAKVRL